MIELNYRKVANKNMEFNLKDQLKVIKRDNKKVDFHEEKIALAIKKGFDSVASELYDEKDINEVFHSVLKNIEDNYKEKKTITIEEIQDIIEKQLMKNGYQDVYEAFSKYRDKRSESRKAFLSEPKQHKLIKVIEKISLKDAK